MRNLSYENEMNLHENELVSKNSFSYERFRTWTRFETKAKGNSKLAYSSKSFCMVIAREDRDNMFLLCKCFLPSLIINNWVIFSYPTDTMQVNPAGELPYGGDRRKCLKEPLKVPESRFVGVARIHFHLEEG